MRGAAPAPFFSTYINILSTFSPYVNEFKKNHQLHSMPYKCIPVPTKACHVILISHFQKNKKNETIFIGVL